MIRDNYSYQPNKGFPSYISDRLDRSDRLENYLDHLEDLLENSNVNQFLTLLKDPEVQAYFLSPARLETLQRIQEGL